MPVSILKIIESFDLGFDLPPVIKELPETSSEESATQIAEHVILTLLHQLRSCVLRKMTETCEDDELVKKVSAIAEKEPSKRTEEENAYMAQIYEEVEEYIDEFSTIYMEMYYGSLAENESYDIRYILREIFGVKEVLGRYEPDYINEFMRYYMCIQKDLPSGKTEQEDGLTVTRSGRVLTLDRAIDYYTNMIRHVKANANIRIRTRLEILAKETGESYYDNYDNWLSDQYHRHESRKEEKHIIEEYIYRYIPGIRALRARENCVQ